MKVIAMRGLNTFLVEISKDKYALVNLENKNISYAKLPDVFLKFGYFKEPIINDEINEKIKALLDLS